MALVYTKVGHLEEELLERSVHEEAGVNYFKVSTRWHLRERLTLEDGTVLEAGELMREDQAPSILAGPGARSVHGLKRG